MNTRRTDLLSQRKILSDMGQLSTLVETDDPKCVLDEVRTTMRMTRLEVDFDRISETMEDVLKLFSGEYPGYRACNTYYHDIKHTTDTFLAMARLIHGACSEGIELDGYEVSLGLVSALMHDVGYIQEVNDDAGTGAKHTPDHVIRSIQFIVKYLEERGFPESDVVKCKNSLLCTGLNTQLGSIRFVSKQNELLSKMLGTSDLLGQVSDRIYLEKLAFLYKEFEEAEIPGFENELDLIKKTLDFYQTMKERLSGELSGTNRFMKDHFRLRWGIERDLYDDAINRTLRYLKWVLENHKEDYSMWFRRHGRMEDLDEKE